MVAAHEHLGDPQLIAEIRAGRTGAFDVLYSRHRDAARFLAEAQADNASDAEDVVSEAFTVVFAALLAGKGPDEFFRRYLLTVVRRMAHRRNLQAARAIPAEDELLDAVVDFDPIVSAFESTVMVRAFRSLPERWQSVIWYMDIEQMKPAAAALLVGISPNGVSSLLIRAREGLRQAYLQHHIELQGGHPCKEFAGQLGKYVRNKLSRSALRKLELHLDGCEMCTALFFDLRDIQSGMQGGTILALQESPS